MGSKLSSHVRHNVIGYLALFFAGARRFWRTQRAVTGAPPAPPCMAPNGGSCREDVHHSPRFTPAGANRGARI